MLDESVTVWKYHSFTRYKYSMRKQQSKIQNESKIKKLLNYDETYYVCLAAASFSSLSITQLTLVYVSSKKQSRCLTYFIIFNKLYVSLLDICVSSFFFDIALRCYAYLHNSCFRPSSPHLRPHHNS